jgi:chromosome segregation ATPase
LKEADKNYEKLQADFDVTERENDDLARAIEEIEEQNSDIEGIVEAYENDLCELRSSVEKLNASVQQAEHERERAQKQVDLIRTENESLVGKLAENNLALQAYKKEFHSKFLEMKEQYMEMEQLYTRSKREHNQLQSDYLMEIKNLNAINRSLQDDRSSLQSAIELYKSKIAELEAFRKHQEPLRVVPTSLLASHGVKTSTARQKVFGILDENSVCSSFDRNIKELEALERHL